MTQQNQAPTRQYSPLAWGFGIGCGLILASMMVSAILFGGCFALMLGGTVATVASTAHEMEAAKTTADTNYKAPIAPPADARKAEPAQSIGARNPATRTVTLLRIANNAATLQVNGPGDQTMSTTLTKGEILIGDWTVDHVSPTAVYLKKSGAKKPLYIGMNDTVALE